MAEYIVWVCIKEILLMWFIFYFYLIWPPVTSNDLWGQNDIVFNAQGYCMSMYKKNGPLGLFSTFALFCTFLPFFALFWPLVTSNYLQGQKNITFNAQLYHMSMYVKNYGLQGIFKFWSKWPLLTSKDLIWPRRSKSCYSSLYIVSFEL